MTRFAELPAGDRWRVLDAELPKIIAAATTAATVDPSDELSLDELAEKHGCTVSALVKKLRALGAAPYRLGKRWHVRRRSYVIALESAEAAEAGE